MTIRYGKGTKEIKLMRKTIALSFVIMLGLAANVFAGAEARMTGKIVDATTKAPIKDATITLEAVEGKTVKQEVKAKADGSYAVFVLDGTIRYKFVYSAPDYAPFEEVLKLSIGTTMQRDIPLVKGSAVPAAAGGAPAAADPAVEAYNAGAALANSGDLAGAMAKFEAAVAAKPDLMAAWTAIAKTAYKLNNHAKAIEAAKKVVEIDSEDADMWTVLHHSYEATGDKANAKIAAEKMPKNAGGLFNDAAALINKGNDADAEPLLKQAIAADPAMAQSYYELGMIYVRGGKSAEAKEMLNKYLELDPNGKDAATAKEMQKYLQ